LVVLLELGPQSSGLDAHDRVGARIEVAPTVEHVDAEGVLLDSVAAAFKRPLYEELQEAAQHRRLRERLAVEDTPELSHRLVGRHGRIASSGCGTTRGVCGHHGPFSPGFRV
jgi:hypothetical protein